LLFLSQVRKKKSILLKSLPENSQQAQNKYNISKKAKTKNKKIKQFTEMALQRKARS